MSHVDIGRYRKRMIQLFWDPEPRNDDSSNSPVWCLGHKYESGISRDSVGYSGYVSQHSAEERPPPVSVGVQSSYTTNCESSEQVEEEASSNEGRKVLSTLDGDDAWPDSFLDDFESRLHFTYRSSFPPIPKATDPKANAGMTLSVRLKSQIIHQNGFTSDTGWGCMIRSGQSLLANALAILKTPPGKIPTICELRDKELLNWFADDPKAPFSIHKFVEHGAATCEIFPGQWFGPSATAKCIQALTNKFDDANLKVYVTGDGPDVYEDKLYQIATSGSHEFTPVLLLVGTRLGIERVTPVYWEALKESLKMSQSVGIAGGRPSSSHYFIGTQRSSFFYLDPHQTQAALPYRQNPDSFTPTEIGSCHTRRLRRMSIEELDPSMLIAFLFRDKYDWLAWRRKVDEASCKAIFHVEDTAPVEHGLSTDWSLALEVETLEDTDDERT